MKTMVAATLMLPIALAALPPLATAVNFDNLHVGRRQWAGPRRRRETGNPKWTVEQDATAPSNWTKADSVTLFDDFDYGTK